MDIASSIKGNWLVPSSVSKNIIAIWLFSAESAKWYAQVESWITNTTVGHFCSNSSFSNELDCPALCVFNETKLQDPVCSGYTSAHECVSRPPCPREYLLGTVGSAEYAESAHSLQCLKCYQHVGYFTPNQIPKKLQ